MTELTTKTLLGFLASWIVVGLGLILCILFLADWLRR